MFTIIKIKTNDFLRFNEKSLNITEIVFDNKQKQFKIESLKKTVKEIKEEESHLISVAEVQAVGAENYYLCNLEEKDSVIIRLEAQLCSENLSLNLYTDGNHGLTEDSQKPLQCCTSCEGRWVVDQVRSEDVESSEPFMSQ